MRGVDAGVIAEARGHPLGVPPAGVELRDRQQPGVPGQLPVVPPDNDSRVWEKVEADLLISLRRAVIRPPVLC